MNLTTLSQEERIQRFENDFDLFHKSYKNNYSYELVNKNIDRALLVENRKQSLSHLNESSYELCSFCISCLKDLRQNGSLADADLKDINAKLKDWKSLITGGNSFATYDYAKEIVNTIHSHHYPFYEKLRSEQFKYIIAGFLSVSDEFKSFIRVAFYADKQDFQQLFKTTLTILKEDPELFSFIERVEIAKEDFPLTVTKGEDFPLFSVIFNYKYIMNASDPMVKRFLSKFDFVNVFQENLSISYSKRLANDLIISQGFKNYKKYLFLIGELDTVYDAEENYAFSLNKPVLER